MFIKLLSSSLSCVVAFNVIKVYLMFFFNVHRVVFNSFVII